MRSGCGAWASAFRENDIDETVLPSLTHENLNELGVTSLGHRLKLLDAIAALRTDTGVNAPSVGAATASSTLSAHPEDRAERRQVTVMFSDLVGSTALSARMDPEDLREIISAYQKCVAENVQRFGGFVAKYEFGIGSEIAAPIIGASAYWFFRCSSMAMRDRVCIGGSSCASSSASLPFWRRGVGAFPFLSAERTIAVPALAIASPQVAPEFQALRRPLRHTPVSRTRPGGCCRNARSFGSAYTGGARKPGGGACRHE